MGDETLVKTHTSFKYSNRNIKEHFFAKTQYNTMNHYILLLFANLNKDEITFTLLYIRTAHNGRNISKKKINIKISTYKKSII